jgi:adenylate cyclase
VGDAVHVMFNAPLDQPDHASRAVRCALAVDAFARRFAALEQARGMAFGGTRIGVNTGRAVVGNCGGQRRLDYTAQGDAINTAARIEGANKHLGTHVLVAAATAAACPEVAVRPAGRLLLAGKSAPIEVVEPLGADPAGRAPPDLYARAYAALEAGAPDAASAFAEAAAAYPDDPLVALHARRSAAGASDTLVVLGEK